MKRAKLGTTGRLRTCALVLALVPAAALAQVSTSVLTGNVVDAATKAPVADVVVTATSPSLQGEQVVVTDWHRSLPRPAAAVRGLTPCVSRRSRYRPFSRTGIDVAA